MYLLVGLGNPGAEYARNRHNIGFMAMDAVAEKYGFSPWKEKSKGLITDGKIGGAKVYLLKPQTYMNLSGDSVQPLAAFYKIPPENIIVFHDELDLAEGVLKVKLGGGSAGHNGLKSITERLGTEKYYRIRMGIGHPGHKDRVHGYVLGNFREEEQEWLDPLLKGVATYIGDLVQDNPNDFASKVMQDMKKLKDIK